MVKKMFVSSLQRAKAQDEPRHPKRAIPKSKARVVGKMLRFRGTDRECSGWLLSRSDKFESVRELPPVQFCGDIG
jgi:hypothetical protein